MDKQTNQDQIFVFQIEGQSEFFYLTADTVCTFEQFTKIFLPNNYQNQTISFNYGSSTYIVSNELNVSITPIVFQSNMTPFNVDSDSDLELKEKLKEKLKNDLDTIWVKHQVSTEIKNNTEIKKDRKSILGESNSVKYQDFEITNISYVQLKSNPPATKLSTKRYFEIFGRFPKFPKSDPKIYTIISFKNNNRGIVQREDTYKYVQNNDKEMYIFKFKDLPDYYYLTEDTLCTKEDIFKFYKKKVEEANAKVGEAKKITVENLNYMQFNRLSNGKQIDTSYYSSIFYKENFLHFFRTYYAVADYNTENKDAKMTDLYDKTHTVRIIPTRDETKIEGYEYYLTNLQAPKFIAELEQKYPNYESPKNIWNSAGLWGTDLRTRTTYITLINKNMARMDFINNEIKTIKKYNPKDEKIISSKNMFDLIGEIPKLIKSPTDYTEITFLSEQILPTTQIIPRGNDYEDFSIKDGKLYCKDQLICKECTNNTFTIYLNDDITGVYLEENPGDDSKKRIYFPQRYQFAFDKKDEYKGEYYICANNCGIFYYVIGIKTAIHVGTYFLRWKLGTDVTAVRVKNIISFFNINGKKDSSGVDRTIKVVINNNVIANLLTVS